MLLANISSLLVTYPFLSKKFSFILEIEAA